MLAVADAYDQMTAPNNADVVLSQSAAVDALERGAGHVWDPIVIDTLTKVLLAKIPITR